jgi:cytochrome c553
MNKFLLTLATLSLLAAGSAQAGGDAAAGQAVFEAACAECHYEDDYSGKSEEEILAMNKAILAGETEHEEPLDGLSEADIANVSAFFASQ